MQNKPVTHFTRSIGNGRWLRKIYSIQKTEDYLPFMKDAVEFEGKLYSTFNNYKQILQYQYGDYWNLPNSINPGHEADHLGYSDYDLEVIKKIKAKALL